MVKLLESEILVEVYKDLSFEFYYPELGQNESFEIRETIRLVKEAINQGLKIVHANFEVNEIFMLLSSNPEGLTKAQVIERVGNEKRIDKSISTLLEVCFLKNVDLEPPFKDSDLL